MLVAGSSSWCIGHGLEHLHLIQRSFIEPYNKWWSSWKLSFLKVYKSKLYKSALQCVYIQVAAFESSSHAKCVEERFYTVMQGMKPLVTWNPDWTWKLYSSYIHPWKLNFWSHNGLTQVDGVVKWCNWYAVVNNGKSRPNIMWNAKLFAFWSAQ